MTNSRDKGARFERQLAGLLRGEGYNARRGQQYCGANGDADVVGLAGIHIEAKHQEQMRLYDWVEQAKRDAKEGELPAVFHKKSRHEILVTMPFKDWMELYHESMRDFGYYMNMPIEPEEDDIPTEPEEEKDEQ